MTEQKRAVRQARLCNCEWGAPTDSENPWHTKLSSCPSVPEWTFWRIIKTSGLPLPEREVRFHPVRRWRMDFAWREHMVAAEVMGGTHQGGRHSRGAGYAEDCVKANTALSMGWRLLRYTPGMLKDSAAVVAQVRGLLTGETDA